MSVKKKQKGSGKEASKGEKPLIKNLRLVATTFFLTYKGRSESGIAIDKQMLAGYLLKLNTHDRRVVPTKYMVSEQMYDSGQPHFHVILVYPKRKQITDPTHYDFRGIHPNIQCMRNMKAALTYLQKQDPHPLTNMDIIAQRRAARAKDSSSLYQLLQQQMRKDPLHFDTFRYCQAHNLTTQIYKANYTKAVRLLRQVQRVVVNNLLTRLPGFRLITRGLIVQRLSPQQLECFDSWDGYATIVRFLNTITTQAGRRQQKSPNLLLTGPPSTGKSALVWQRNPLPGRSSIANHCAVYPMGMKDWFPQYKSDVYSVIYWNQAKLTSYSYDVILQLLDGSPVMLPAKGGGHKKQDNPTIIMTSNMTLDQMIIAKFGYKRTYVDMARANMAARVTNVVIPRGYDLFLLQRLLVPA